jgi:hypothetical protein
MPTALATRMQRVMRGGAYTRAKVALGERGPVWWSDGAPDFNRHLVKNTPYRSWYLEMLSRERPSPSVH